MSLVPCPRCERHVFDASAPCPHCDSAPPSRSTSAGALLLGLGLSFSGCVIPSAAYGVAPTDYFDKTTETSETSDTGEATGTGDTGEATGTGDTASR